MVSLNSGVTSPVLALKHAFFVYHKVSYYFDWGGLLSAVFFPFSCNAYQFIDIRFHQPSLFAVHSTSTCDKNENMTLILVARFFSSRQETV